MKDLNAVIIKVATSKSAIVIMNVKSYSESSRVLGSDVREGGKETQLPLFSLTACSSVNPSLHSFVPLLSTAFAVQLLRDVASLFIYPFPIN